MMHSTRKSLGAALSAVALLFASTAMASVETTVEAGTAYVDQGATAHDAYDGDLTAEIVTISNVDSDTPGDYTVTYRVTDSSGNTAEAERRVRVVEKTSLNITAPLNGSILYVQNEADAAFTLTSTTSEAVEYVEYLIDGVNAGMAYEAPFTVRGSMANAPLADGQHTVVAQAKLAASGNFVTAESTFTVATALGEDDSNGNGLPDNPFLTLAIDGDAWVSEMRDAGCNVSMLRMDGNSVVDDDMPVVLCLDQRVDVTIPRALIAEDEVGVALVAIAENMEDLFGTSEAAQFAAAPAGLRLMDGGCYVHVSVITSNDGGQSFSDVPLARTAMNPVEVNIQNLASSRNSTSITAGTLSSVDGAVYSHASYVDSDEIDGLTLASAEDAWQQVASHNGFDAMIFDLHALSSVVAPYETAATDAPLIGDVNDDGIIDAFDVTLVEYMVAWNPNRLDNYLRRNNMNPVHPELADVDRDGEITEWDAALIELTLATGLDAVNDDLRADGMPLAHVGEILAH